MSDSKLFSPFTLGSIELKNRVVMAPMTRSRAIGGVPNDLMVTYYTQRAEAGLIITEGTSPSPNGMGYPRIPGLYRKEQVAGWKKVTESVHRAGSRIFAQLMHTGRVTHPLNLPAGGRVVAPSALAAKEPMYTDQKQLQPVPVPEEMTGADIEAAVEEYAAASQNAVDAGFDGVELHGANGYLVDQFLNTASNQRKDEWGGSVENRIRFAVEVAKRAGKRIGFGRLGIRVSPYGAFNSMSADAQMDDVYTALARELSTLGLLYIHTVDHSPMGAPHVPDSVKAKIRDNFRGKLILSGGYDRARAEHDLAEGKGDLVAFAKPFISNPKWVSRMESGKAAKAPDQATFYTPGEKGYTDYPVEAE